MRRVARKAYGPTMKGERMRQLTVSLAIAAVGLLVAACGGDNPSSPASSTTTKTTTTTTTTTPPQPPVAPAALPNVLLSPAEVDGALGITGTTSQKKSDKLSDENANQQFPQGWKFPAECFYALDPGQTPVYANSGYVAVSGDNDSAPPPPGSDDPNPQVNQFVVSFPSAKEASAFFTTSSQQWPACANRQFTAPGDADNPEVAFTIGQVSNADSILTTTISANMTLRGKSLTNNCQRALTARNNLVIDVGSCGKDPGGLAVKVVNQIAGKLDSANTNLLAGSLSKGYGLNNCQPVAAAQLTGFVLAELDCGQSPDPAGPASASYRLLPHADALAAEFKNMIQGMALTACGPNTGDSPGKWQQGQNSGQTACGTQKDVATMVWTTDGKNVLGSIRASNTDLNALHDWWLANG
jgi:PknH-like extracellular domain